MKNFMNDLYSNGVGKEVTGEYLDVPFIGNITDMRCTFGGGINVYIDLEPAIQIGTSVRDSIILEGEELFKGYSVCARNVKVNL